MSEPNGSWSRRSFLRLGAAGAAVIGAGKSLIAAAQDASADFDAYLTPQEKFRDVSRGNPLPHRLPPEKMVQVGLTREPWALESLSDPEHKASCQNPLTKEKGTALDGDGL